MRALVLDCTLDGRPEPAICAALPDCGVYVDHEVATGIEWPISHYEITVIVTPAWLGCPSSLAERVLARLPEAGADRVAAVVAIGDEADKHQVSRTFAAELWALGLYRSGARHRRGTAQGRRARPLPPRARRRQLNLSASLRSSARRPLVGTVHSG